MAFTNILHPNRYHGFSKNGPFFEGWYYKLVSADEKNQLAVIPGVYIGKDQESSHSFVQVFYSNKGDPRFHRYAYDAFRAVRDAFEVHVGPNTFKSDSIQLAIDNELGQMQGTVRFSGLNRWPVRFTSPGAMGWFSWVPLMECYHGVVSMDHGIKGQLKWDDRVLDFSGGRGYIEKDWGKQFPSAWVWGQSNHFETPGVSLMLSVAVVPWIGRSFGGFIIGFLHQGEIRRFATYNGSKIEAFSIHDTEVHLAVSNASHRLKIRALRGEGSLLQAPTMASMDRRIVETLNARLDVRFEDLQGRVLFEGTGMHAGLERVGDLAGLRRLVHRGTV